MFRKKFLYNNKKQPVFRLYRKIFRTASTEQYLALVFLAILQLCTFSLPSHADADFSLSDSQIRPLLDKAESLLFTEYEQSLEFAKKALILSEESSSAAGSIYSLIVLGHIMEAQDDDLRAGKYYESALQIESSVDTLLDDPNIMYFLSDGLRVLERYSDAHRYLEKGISIKKKEADQTYLMKAYERKANLYRLEEKHQDSIQTSLISLDIAEKLSSEQFILRAYKSIAQASKKLGDHRTSLEYNEKSMVIVKKGGDERKIAQFLEYLSTDQRSLGQYPEALKNAKAALKVQRKLNDSYRISNLLLNISIIYLRLTRYDQSLEAALELLSISEKNNDLNKIASTCNQIGRIYERLNQVEQASHYYERSLSLNKTEVDEKHRASALRSIASIRRKERNFDEALGYAEQAQEIYKKLKNLNGVESVERTIANIYKEMGNKQMAVKHHEIALKIATGLGDKWGEASSWIHIGSMLADEDLVTARKSLNTGLEIANAIGSKSLQLDAHRGLVNLERNSGDYVQSLFHYDMAYKLIHEIDNKEIDSRIMELKIIQETEKMEREVEMLKNAQHISDLDLKRKNAELESLNARNTISNLKLEQERSRIMFLAGLILIIGLALAFVYMRYRYLKEAQRILNDRNHEIEKKNINLEELNETKNRFFSIISHDLRSPITAIVGLSDMLKENLETINEKELRQCVEAIHEESDHTFGLLENLLSWAVLQLKNADPIPREYLVKEICQPALGHLKTQSELKEITVINYISDTDTLYADKNMIAAVVRNLIANAIKFTPHDGRITLYSEVDNSHITIHVKDSGIGIEKTVQENIFRMDELVSRKGTDGEAGTGFGLALCKELIEKSNGRLNMVSEVGKGSDFFFTLPRTEND